MEGRNIEIAPFLHSDISLFQAFAVSGYRESARTVGRKLT